MRNKIVRSGAIVLFLLALAPSVHGDSITDFILSQQPKGKVPAFFSMGTGAGTCQLGTDSLASHPAFPIPTDAIAIARFPFFRVVNGFLDFITPALQRNTVTKKRGDPLLVPDQENDFIFDDGWWFFTAPPVDRFNVVLAGFDITHQAPDLLRRTLTEGNHGTYFMGDVDGDGCEDQMWWKGDPFYPSFFGQNHSPAGWFPETYNYQGTCFLSGGTGVFENMTGEITVMVQTFDADGFGSNVNGGPDAVPINVRGDSIQRGQIPVQNLFRAPSFCIPVEPGTQPRSPDNGAKPPTGSGPQYP